MPSLSTSSNIRIFAEQLEAYRKKTHKRLDLAKQELAKKTLAKLVSKSPVLTGQYIRGHKVSLNSRSQDVGTAPATLKMRKNPLKGKQIGTNIGVDRRSIEMSVKGKGLQTIMQASYDDVIYISNNVPHRFFVEFLGWPGVPAYHVYGMNKLEMLAQAKAIVKAYENKKIP